VPEPEAGLAVRPQKALRGLARSCLNVLRLAPVRRFLRERRVLTLSVGPGAGLRFSPGPSTERYGSGSNELPVQEALASLLFPGAVLYDVGANVGFLTMIGARLVGATGLVYAFEPVRTNTAVLRRNLRLNGFHNVVVIEKAVSSVPGREQLILALDSGGAAISVAERPPDAAGVMEVEVTSIDEMIRGGGARPPTVVKIDVEGAEIQVLRGMEKTLELHRPAVVYEIDGPDEKHVDAKADLCRAFLEARGYRVSRLPDSYPDNRWRVRHYLARREGEAQIQGDCSA